MPPPYPQGGTLADSGAQSKKVVPELEAGQAPASGVDLIAAQYAGPKAELRPIYDALIRTIKSLGKDVEIAPKKA